MIDNSKEYILCAAVQVPDKPTICGFRHSYIFQQIKDFRMYKISEMKKSVQGFLTSKGRFVDRKEAYGIALEAGQIEPIFTKVLLSEDLY